MRFPGKTFIFIAFLASLLSCSKDPEIGGSNGNIAETATPFSPETPAAFSKMLIPKDNPFTVEGVQLGRMLFYDPILSGDSTLSCGSCHNQQFAFTDNGKQFSKGITGAEGNMNAMQIFNLGWHRAGFFWDGRAATLEQQVTMPVENPVEMHENWPNIVTKLSRHPQYPDLFKKAFGKKEITRELAGKALAQFVRTIVSGKSKFDLYQQGNRAVFIPSEENGLRLFLNDPKFDRFGSKEISGADCFHCHSTPFFNEIDPQLAFKNNGLSDDAALKKNPGLMAVTGRPDDLGKFKIPSLRNVALTAPYMHDGRFKTLEEVVEHYNNGGTHSSNIDPLMASVKFKDYGGKLQLSASEKQDLINFLKTLTDTSLTNNPAYSNPFK